MSFKPNFVPCRANQPRTPGLRSDAALSLGSQRLEGVSMNKLNRSNNLSHFSARTLALLSVAAALAAGCAANPPRVEQAFAADRPDDWAQRIHSLPVEVHGALPSETAMQTIAAIDHGTANLADA